MNRVDEIEYMVACNELTAAQVFTQMRQLIQNKNIEAERDALQAEIEQLKNPWVSVEDSQPPKNDYYLAWDGGPDTRYFHYNCDDGVHYWNFQHPTKHWLRTDNPVTHWMPIPKLEGKG